MVPFLEVFLIKILFIGDIVGRPGRKIVKELLKGLVEQEELDLVVANGENAAGGSGLTLEVCRELLDAGIDVITMGNHTWSNRGIYQVFDQVDCVIRPANYPEGTPGNGYYLVEAASGMTVGVINLMGQVYLDPIGCPFHEVDRCLKALKKQTNLILVDFHAEATSEKIAMGWYLDGRVTAVLGTHTHVVTADERILPQGTAYLTDVGMTGPTNSVLGVKPEIIVEKFLTKRPIRFELAGDPVEFNGAIIEADEFGKATGIRRVHLTI